MKLSSSLLVSCFSALAIVACAGKKFQGSKGNSATTAPVATGSLDGEPSGQNNGNAVVAQNTTGSVLNTTKPAESNIMTKGSEGVTFKGKISEDDKKFVKKCLDLWGKHPFKVIDLDAKPSNYKEIKTSVSVLGINARPVEDTEATDHDVLTIIDPSINIAGKAEYKLLNPKGWYCMKFNVTAVNDAKTKVRLNCSAKLAKSNVLVGVDTKDDKGVIVGVNGSTVASVGGGSNPDGIAQGNVIIDGDVELIREGCAK
jgi:hypothetical protein